jgi:hypothetical protein
MAFDCADGQMHVAGDLFIGETRRSLLGHVELPGCQMHPRPEALDGWRGGTFAAGKELGGLPFRGDGLPGLTSAAKSHGGFGPGFGGVEDRAHILEGLGDRPQKGMVPVGDRVGVCGPCADQVAVDLAGQGGDSGGSSSAGC